MEVEVTRLDRPLTTPSLCTVGASHSQQFETNDKSILSCLTRLRDNTFASGQLADNSMVILLQILLSIDLAVVLPHSHPV